MHAFAFIITPIRKSTFQNNQNFLDNVEKWRSGSPKPISWKLLVLILHLLKFVHITLGIIYNIIKYVCLELNY